MRSRWLLSVVSSTIAVIAGDGVAFAQSNDAAAQPRVRPAAPPSPAVPSTTERTGEEIVVTARRREESLQSVPVAVTAYSQASLDRLSVRQASDLNTITPALTLTAAAGRRDTPSVGIRGQLTNDTLIGADPAVAFYMDDVILTPNQGINLGLYDLANVQVLKGPQGTLFGRNTTGGAILIITAKPEDTLGAMLRATYGNYDTVGLTGYVNVPITSTLAVRAAGNFTRHDGYSRVVAGPQTGRQLDRENNRSGRFSAKWQPTDNFSNLTTYAYDKARSSGSASVLRAVSPIGAISLYNGKPLFAGGPSLPSVYDALAQQQGRSIRQIAADAPLGERVETLFVANTTTIKFGDVALKNILGYRHVDYNVQVDGDGTALPLFAYISPAKVNQWSDEVQLSGHAFDGATQWIAGFYYFHQNGLDFATSDAFVGLNPSTPIITGGRVRNRSISGYLQQTTEILPKLSLTTGIRYTSDRREARPFAYYDNRAPAGAACALFNANGVALKYNPALAYNGCFVDLQKTFARPTWTISLDYKIDRNSLIYIASRRGYRTGGFNLRGTDPTSLLPFRPETVTDLEVGLKLERNLGGINVRSNSAIYGQKYKGIQRNVSIVLPSGQITSSTINAASATIWGGETELTVVPVTGLDFNIGYSYVHPRYDSFPTADGDFSDRDFARVPAHQFNATINYRVIKDERAGIVSLTGNYNYRSGYYVDESYQTGAQVRRRIANPATAALIPDVLAGSRIPGVGLFNGRMSWDGILGSRISAALFVKNIADKKYPVSGLALYQSLGLDFNVYGDPRSYGLELAVKY